MTLLPQMEASFCKGHQNGDDHLCDQSAGNQYCRMLGKRRADYDMAYDLTMVANTNGSPANSQATHAHVRHWKIA